MSAICFWLNVQSSFNLIGTQAISIVVNTGVPPTSPFQFCKLDDNKKRKKKKLIPKMK